MNRITVLLGGDSSEREISLLSGKAIANALRSLGNDVLEVDPAAERDFCQVISQIKDFGSDLVFLGLHGGAGENGEIQAALSQAGLCHTGSGYKCCALTMDKYISKLVAAAEGIPVPDHILMRGDYLQDYNDPNDYQGIADHLGLPLIAKPNDGGSSVGISKVERIEQLKPAVQLALQYSSSVLLERFIAGRELTVTVLAGKALPLVEIKPKSGWYDYGNKYKKGSSDYIVPAEVDESLSQLAQLYAERLWQAFGCAGYARMDFRYDGEKPYFLEVNTLPGMTELSLTPMAAKAVGLSFNDLISTIVELALKG